MLGQLENIDSNKNQQIELTELQKKLSEGFFDKEENLKALSNQLKYNEHVLEKSFCDTLQKAYSSVMMKDIASQTAQDKALIKLYAYITITAPSPTIPSLYKINVGTDTPVQTKELPIIRYEQGYVNVALDKLLAWGQQLPGYGLMRIQKSQEYSQKYSGANNMPLVNDWVNFECSLWTLEKYHQELIKEQSPLLSKAGYTSQEQADKDATLFASYMEYTQSLLQKDPSYNKAIDLLNRYMKDINALKKPKNGEEQYNIYQKEVTSLLETYQVMDAVRIIEDTDIDNLNKEGFVSYVDSMQNLQKYSADLSMIQKKYPQAIAYTKYVEKLQTIQKEHGGPDVIKNAIDRYSSYMQQIDIWKQQHNVITNIDRYQKYSQSLYSSGVLIKMQFVGGMYDTLQGVGKNQFSQSIFLSMTSHAESEQKRQAIIDASHATLKHYVPWLSTTGNAAWGLREGWWKAIAGMSNSIKMGVGMLTGMDDHSLKLWLQSSDKTLAAFTGEKFQSTLMNEPPVKDGHLNLHFDNTINLVGQQVANMIILLSGAGVAGKGLQTLGMTTTIASKAGLLTSALGMQLGNYFNTGLDVGLGSKEALAYALVQGGANAALELINPNNAVLGTLKINPLNLFAQGAGQKLLPSFLGSMGKEIIGEIAQEELQSFAEIGINRLSNMYKNGFNTEFTWADFASTAILTGLTTGIVSSKGIYQQEKISLDQQKFIAYIKGDVSRTQEYGKKLQHMQKTGIITQEQFDVITKEIGYVFENNGTKSTIYSHGAINNISDPSSAVEQLINQENNDQIPLVQDNITIEQEQQLNQQIDNFIIEAKGLEKELKQIYTTISGKQKSIAINKIGHKIIHYLHKFDTLLGGHIHHFIDNTKKNIGLFKDPGLYKKSAAFIGITADVLHLGFEIFHIQHAYHDISHGTYNHYSAEALSNAVNVLYTAINHFKLQLSLRDLQIKDKVTIQSFRSHLLELQSLRSDAKLYKQHLLRSITNYSSANFDHIIYMIPEDGTIDFHNHVHIVLALGDIVETTYYGKGDNTIVDKSIANILKEDPEFNNRIHTSSATLEE